MDAAEVLDQVKATVGATLKVTDTLPEPKTGASEKGGAGIAVTGKGRMQENSESANPKATPVRQPEVRKGGDELGG